MRRELTAIIEREGDGYVALCPEVDIVSQGDSAAEAQENLQAAIALFFETASSEEIERRLSGGVYLTRIEEDFHVIDDPPEDEAGRGDLNVADDPEHGAESNAPPSADMRIREGDETLSDPAQSGKTARLRNAADSAAGALKRGATGIGRAARTLGDGVAGSAGAVGGRVSDMSARAGRLASGSLKKIPVRRLRPMTSAVANIGNTLLATDVALGLDRWMRAVFGSGRASPYDKALDLVYNTLRQHGGDHRIFDGSHDLVGAWKAIAKARPDDSWLQRAEGYVSALWKDMATPSGLPVVTWDKQAFDAVATFLNQTLGISRAWVKDMATFTATEFIGAVVGAVALVLSWNKADIRRFSEVVGSLGLSALVGANPIMVMVTIVGLAKCFHESRHGAGFNRILSGGGRGMAGTTALLGASRLMPAPAWMTVMLGVVSYLVAAKLYDKSEPKAEEVARIVRDWFGSREWTSSCSDLARNTYLRGKAVVGSVDYSELRRDVAITMSAWSRASAGAIESTWSAGYRSTIRLACAAVPQWGQAGS